MAEGISDLEGAADAIISLLGLSPGVQREVVLDRDVHPDFIFHDGDDWYIIEVANTASVESLSQLALYEKLWRKRGNTHFVLAAKVIPTTVLETADRIGVKIVYIPRSVALARERGSKRAKLTTEKAWKVPTRLLKDHACSIRQISIREDLSYGWAHATVKRMLARGIAVQKGGLIQLGDSNKLLDAASWERPLADLQIGSIRTSLQGSYETAETLTRTAETWGMPIAFTAYTSATLYFGYGAKHDTVYCYISNKESYLELKHELPEGSNTEIICYTTDRNIFDSTRQKEGIRIVSPEQTLLDLAGLGYSARDFALKMVKQYASIAKDNE